MRVLGGPITAGVDVASVGGCLAGQGLCSGMQQGGKGREGWGGSCVTMYPSSLTRETPPTPSNTRPPLLPAQ